MMHRNALVLLLAALVLGCQASVDNNVLRGKSDAAVEPIEQRRHLISFWSILFELIHVPCPPGPLGDHCRNATNSTASAAAVEGTDEEETDSAGEKEVNGNGNANTSNSESGLGGTAIAGWSIWLMVVAAAAAAAALIAAAVGQRRDKEDLHPLNGVVSRRMNLFTSLADGNLCVDRPPRVV